MSRPTSPLPGKSVPTKTVDWLLKQEKVTPKPKVEGKGKVRTPTESDDESMIGSVPDVEDEAKLKGYLETVHATINHQKSLLEQQHQTIQQQQLALLAQQPQQPQ